MEMTENEILRSYREAKYKKEQVKILADLNVCTVDEIIDILKRNDVDWRALPREYMAKRNNCLAVPKEAELSGYGLDQALSFVKELLKERARLHERIDEITKQIDVLREALNDIPKQGKGEHNATIDI